VRQTTELKQKNTRHPQEGELMRVGVIGTGITGLGAAWALSKAHDVTVYEKEDRLGGHASTIDIDYGDKSIPVDTGFIVFNEPNYPNLNALFDHLGVESEDSDMSFAFSSHDRSTEWCSDSWSTIFAQRRNILNPTFLSMLLSILRFNKIAVTDSASDNVQDLSLGDYLRKRGFGQSFQNQYLLPLGSAIWSTSSKDMLEFPAKTFIQFFENHCLVAPMYKRPIWRTVKGGSREYVKKLSAAIDGTIRMNAPVVSVTRSGGHVDVTDRSGHVERFDQVVMACHSDETLDLLADPSNSEVAVLGALRYAPNQAVVHRDPALMPKNERVWASWNYSSSPPGQEDTSPASVTYWMNRLQNIDRNYPIFVSLNPQREPDPDLTFASFEYSHPQLDAGAIGAQSMIGDIQGLRNTWFCGAYSGYGFHEDGLSSGLAVAESLGATRLWARDNGYASKMTMPRQVERIAA
jgi:hypothetical protein